MSNFTVEWAQAHMPRIARAIESLPDLSGVRLAMSMHLDLKMLPLVHGLARKGAKLYITTCNPATVRDEVVAVMRSYGAQVEASKDMSNETWHRAIVGGLDWGPTHLCEMGSDYTHALLSEKRPWPEVRAGLEATGSGINRLQGELPPWPIFNWDDLPVKEGLHNRHMVGLTTWQAFFSRTLLSLHEKRVLVVGYGTVGQGLAATARAYGGMVMVAELNPARVLQARYDGWLTGSVEELAPLADVIVTATGAHHVLPWTIIQRLKDGCFLLNSGHRLDEIELAPLLARPSVQCLPLVTSHDVAEGRQVYLLAGGAMANLTAGEGDSLNSFDVTLAVMASGIGHIVGAGEKSPGGVHLLPPAAWEKVL